MSLFRSLSAPARQGRPRLPARTQKSTTNPLAVEDESESFGDTNLEVLKGKDGAVMEEQGRRSRNLRGTRTSIQRTSLNTQFLGHPPKGEE